MKMKKLLCTALSIVLALGMSPTTALANTTSEATAAGATASPVQLEGTPGVDYAEGEVLVAVRGGVSALETETATSVLAQVFGSAANEAGSSSFTIGESLATVSVDDIAAAAEDVGAADEVNLSAGAGDTALASTDADDVEIVVLKCDDVAQAIADLRSLDCVVVAQPNYLYSLIDDEGTDEEAASALASAVQGDSSASIATSDEAATTASDSAANASGDFGAATLSTSATESDGSATLANAAASAGGASTLASVSTGTSEPFYSAQWSLQGEESLEANSYSGTTSMDVEGAWAEGAGDEEGGDVVVAVLDSGVDYTHEELAANMWTGGGAAWSTALGGGTYGYNALAGSPRNDPMDKCGHGTHVSSTIAAAWNGTGIAGINNKVKIMAVRAIASAAGESSTASVALAYNYVITAKRNGVNVVATNNSYGLGNIVASPDLLEQSMLYQAGEEGIVSVFSSGNSALDNDEAPTMQHGTSNPYLILVGAANSASTMAEFSQWGERSVDVFAPGTRVLAATTTYGEKSGTVVSEEVQYTPWLRGSASSQSAYFVDDAGTTQRDDGISYDLVSYTLKDGQVEYGESYGPPELLGRGYPDGDNNSSYRFNLQDVSLQKGERLAVRMTIPADTWESYVSSAQEGGYGDNLYIAAVGNYSGFGTNVSPALVPYVHYGSGWALDGYHYISSRDGNWCNFSSPQSLSEVDEGKNSDGSVTVLFWASAPGKTTFTSDEYLYVDDISLGWAISSDCGTEKANGTYRYADGTSMASPNAVGVVSLLCSRAKAASGQSDYLQDAATAREIVSFVKGGVTQVDSLSDLCKTGGVTNADASYSAYKDYLSARSEREQLDATADLVPVPESITDNGDGTCTILGSFFGAEKGSATFDGTELEVTGWSDTAITFKSLCLGKETIGKVVVNKGESGLYGQSYLAMPADASSVSTFDSLPTPDFEIAYTVKGDDGQVTTVATNASEVTPQKMAAAAGYVYVYGTAVDEAIPVLMRYDIANKAWDEKNYLEGCADEIYSNYGRCYASMVAGSSKIYLKVIADGDPGKDTRLFTLDATTGRIVHDVAIADTQANGYGSLGLYDGKLYLVGGAEGEPICSTIYPDTGEVYWSSAEKLPVNVYFGTVTNNGSDLTVTGSFNNANADFTGKLGYEPGQRNQQIDITFGADGSTTLKASASVFFPETGAASEYGLDTGQGFSNVAAAAFDGGVLMTGPVKGDETADMIDTWIYRTSTQKWYAVTATRFAPAVEASSCACTYGGTYYVMAQDMQVADGVFQRFGGYSLEKLGLSDEAVTPTSDAETSAPTPEVKRVKVYRLYNVATSEHLWTTDANEYEVLPAYGWTQEGTAWLSPTEGAAVYRLYNPDLGTHHYTSDVHEVAELVAKWGWVLDNGGEAMFYSADAGAKGSVDVCRMYNGDLSQHLLTTDANEYATLPAYGWQGEGVAFRAYPA